MSQTRDSIYPDFLRAGLGNLRALGLDRELLALFTALEYFRRDLQEPSDVPGVLQVTQRYVTGLNLFHTTAFFLVNPVDFTFGLTLCVPGEGTAVVDALVRAEISAGRFAWALRQRAPVSFGGHGPAGSERGVFHSLGVATRTVGMFCGLLRSARVPSQEITFSLLSTLLGTSADTLAAVQKTAVLDSQIKTLSGLLPICAWCKKVRDDQGYWKQIESYVETHSAAVFSHGVCPDCKRQFAASLAVKAK
jgi:hypothetical protein